MGVNLCFLEEVYGLAGDFVWCEGADEVVTCAAEAASDGASALCRAADNGTVLVGRVFVENRLSNGVGFFENVFSDVIVGFGFDDANGIPLGLGLGFLFGHVGHVGSEETTDGDNGVMCW